MSTFPRAADDQPLILGHFTMRVMTSELPAHSFLQVPKTHKPKIQFSISVEEKKKKKRQPISIIVIGLGSVPRVKTSISIQGRGLALLIEFCGCTILHMNFYHTGSIN